MNASASKSLLFSVCFALVATFFLLPADCAASSPPKGKKAEWRLKRSDHFEVYYLKDEAFASEVLRQGERYYDQICADLGFDHVVKKEHLAFWLWDKRCRIYLYATAADYVRETGAPKWSGGHVARRERRIYSFNGAKTFLDQILPHEMAHILFREYVGFENRHVPRWLDEGVAQYAEAKVRAELLEQARLALASSAFIPFEQFNKMTTRGLEAHQARLFYLQAASVVHFLNEEYGGARFVEFLSNLRDGYPVERALSFATAGRLGSLPALEKAWAGFYGATASAELGNALPEEASAPGRTEARSGPRAADSPSAGQRPEPEPARDGLPPPRPPAASDPARGAGAGPGGRAAVGSAAPEFTAPYLSGGEFELAEHLGEKVLVLHWWSMYCASCVQEIPALIDLQKRYPEDVLVVGLNADAFAPSRVRRFLGTQSFQIHYPTALDGGLRVMKAYGSSVLPTTVVIDRKGNLAFRHIGYKPGDGADLERRLNQCRLGSPPPPGPP